MPPQTPDDELEEVQHPTLGTLHFPKNMPQAERDQALEYAIKQKYGLPQNVDLSKDYWANRGTGVKMSDFSSAYRDMHAKTGGVEGAAREVAQGAPRAAKVAAQALGIPTTRQELGETLTPDILRGKVPLWEMAKDTARHLREGWQEEKEAAQNIAAGQPVLPNIAKGVYGIYHGGVEGLPIIGGQMEDLSKRMLAKDYPGAVGAGVGIAGTVLGPKALEHGTMMRAGIPDVEPAFTGEFARRTPPRGTPPGTLPGTQDLRPLPTAPGPRRPAPTATETLDAAANRIFPGKKFGELDPEDQMKVMRSGAAGGPNEPTNIIPKSPRPGPGSPGGPGGAERRRENIGPPLGQPELRDPRTGETPEESARRQVLEMSGGQAPSPVFEDFRQAERRRIDQAVEEERRQGERRQAPGTLPPIPPSTTLPGGPGATLPVSQGQLPSGERVQIVGRPPGPVGTPPDQPLADLLRGWAGEPGTLPPVRPPEEPPPKK